jgi:hypothetical protein
VSESGCEGEEGAEEEGGKVAGMDEGAGVSNSGGDGFVADGTTTGAADRTCSCVCEVFTSVSSDVTFDSKAAMVHCACKELDRSTADSNRLKSIVSHCKSWSMTALGGLSR